MTIDDRRVAIVTGGGSGIGAAAGRQFAKQGAAVALVGRRPDPLSEIVQSIHDSGGEAIAIPADLADPSSPERIVNLVVSKWNRIDVLVNNAATIQILPIEDVDVEMFDHHVAVNVRAPYLLTRAMLPYLRASESAAVVNISSTAAAFSVPGQSIYGLTKAALEYLTRSLAAELAPIVRVNCISPGAVDTPIHLKYAGGDVKALYARIIRELPLARMASAEELGRWIVWLASPESSFVTGAVIPVDGGQALPGFSSRLLQDD